MESVEVHYLLCHRRQSQAWPHHRVIWILEVLEASSLILVLVVPVVVDLVGDLVVDHVEMEVVVC